MRLSCYHYLSIMLLTWQYDGAVMASVTFNHAHCTYILRKLLLLCPLQHDIPAAEPTISNVSMATRDSKRGNYLKFNELLTFSKQPAPPSPKDATRKIASWRAPIMMSTTLLLGLAVSLTHHFMITHLNSRPIEEAALSQKWISRFGTALAFLVKMFFTIAVGDAFVQRQWFNFHNQAYKVQDVDALTNILENVLNFFDSSVWFRNPLLTLVAIVSW
jgi:hypothetical protein